MTLNEVAGAVAPAYIFLNGRFDKNVELRKHESWLFV